MTVEAIPTQTDEEKLIAFEQQVAELRRQILVLTAQRDAAINQRNFHANDTLGVAGELALIKNQT